MMQMAAAMHSSGAPSSHVGISEGARQLAVESHALTGEEGSSGAGNVQESTGLQDGAAQAPIAPTSFTSGLVEGRGGNGRGELVEGGSSSMMEGQEATESLLSGDARLKAGSQRNLQSDELAPKSASLSQKTIQQASSLNAGAAMSGLKPWSKEWVFKGTEGRDSELKTLLQDAQNTARPEALMALLSARTSSGDISSSMGVSAQKNGQMRGVTAQKGMSSDTASVARDRLNGLTSATAEEIEALLMESDLAGSGAELKGFSGEQSSALDRSSGTMSRGTASLGGEAFLSTLQELQGSQEAARERLPQGSQEAARERLPQGSQETARERLPQGSNSSSTRPTDLGNASGVRPQKGKNPMSPEAFGGKGPEEVSGPKKQDPFDALFASSAGVRSMNQSPVGRPEQPQALQVTGMVTQGAMTRERLSSESLVSLTSGIRDLSRTGGGEIRMKLKPESLGELNLRIVTRGNEVGLKIQATDPGAKKVIEESIQYLKESLASNSLQLTRFDVQLAGSGNLSSQMQNQAGGGNQNPQDFAAQAGLTFDAQSQSGFSAAFGQQNGQGGYGSGELSSDSQLGVASGNRSVRQPTASIPSAVMGVPGSRLAAGAGRGRVDLFA